MKVELLYEPELEFGAGRHVDIRFGIKNYGPVTFDDPVAPHEVRVGLVGTPATVEGVKNWLELCRGGIPGKISKKPNLFPSFPGFGKDSCFHCEWILSPKLEGIVDSRQIEQIINKQPRTLGVPMLAKAFLDECRHICEKAPVDVLICAPPQELFNYTDRGVTPVLEGDEADASVDEEDEISLDFHDLLKANALEIPKPIQMIRPITYDENAKEITRAGTTRQLQDAATRAWNFHTALYYKAGGTPWRLVRSSSDLAACFVGIGFYRSRDKKRVHTSVAQVFNERGEGMIMRGGEAKMSEEDRQPHLSRDDIASLLKRVLLDFEREHKHSPARVVVHKTSLFDNDEVAGCNDALTELRIQSRDLLTVKDSFIRLFRSGQYPPLRGTFLNFDEKHSILYTRGSIDFYQMYPGMYVPRSLQLVSAATDQHPRVLAQEILALTKMNWNNTQFDAAFPITVKAARRVGGILRYLESDSALQAGYAFYM